MLYPTSEKRPLPLRPPLAGEKPRPPELPQTAAGGVSYRDPDSGRQVPVVHPEISNAQGGAYSLQPDTPVDIRLPGGQAVQSQFRDYLDMIGVRYEEYKAKSGKPGTRGADLLRFLHQDALNGRLKQALSFDRENDMENFERQEVSRKEVEAFFARLMSDSGYGEAFEAPSQSDHFEKIDVFVKIDPRAHLHRDGAPAYFGIQHTALEPKDEDRKERLARKEGQILRRPETYIPEHPEYGPVTRIFIHENRDMYFPEKSSHSHDSTLKGIERKKGIKPKSWEAFMYNARGERNSLSEKDARDVMTGRVYSLYEQMLTSVSVYLETARVPAHRKDLEGKKAVLEGMLALMKRENPWL